MGGLWGWLQPPAPGSLRGAGAGVAARILVRQGERKCSHRRVYFSKLQGCLLMASQRAVMPAVPPPTPQRLHGTPGVPGALRKLILYVSIAVVLFFIWDGGGQAERTWDPEFCEQPSCTHSRGPTPEGPPALCPGVQFKGLSVEFPPPPHFLLLLFIFSF